MKCPNCNAELKTRPCTECGWPESTQPAPLGFWERRLRARRRRGDDSEGEGCAAISGCCGYALACASTASAVFFYSVGSGAGWTSDGPGMLVFMVGFGVSALVAAMSWLALIGAWIRPHLPAWMRFFLDP